MSVHCLYLRWVGRITKRELLALAVEAFAARYHWANNNQISYLEVFDFRSNFFHDANGFVTHDQAFLHCDIHFAGVHV